MSHKMQGASSSKRGRRHNRSRRVEATDLTYHPAFWVDHLRQIKAHFGSTMLKYLLSHEMASPNFNRELALELLDDEARSSDQRPAFPSIANVHYRFWHLNTDDSLEAFLALCTNVQFLSFRDAAVAAHGNVDVDADVDGDGDDQAAYEPTHAELAGLAHASIVDWHNRTVIWRNDNPSDPHKLQKLVDLLSKAGNSASYLPRWMLQPIHLKTFIFDQLNTTLYGFFQTYVGTKAYRYIIEQSIDNDGLSVLANLEHGRILPSPASGQAYMVKITQIAQPPGTSWNAYRSTIQELQDDYLKAAGTELPSELVYLALTARLQYFYQPVVNILDQREKMGQPQLPLTSVKPAPNDMSVQKLMCKHEVQHPTMFRKYLSKKKRSKSSNIKMASAHNATEHRGPKKGASRHKSNKSSGPKEFKCAWCRRHRPGRSTKHHERDCRIKADHQNSTCEICDQKGHPSRFCPNTKGHANAAEESKASCSNFNSNSKSNKGRRNRGRRHKSNQYLTSQGLAAHDELNAAEALRAIKCAHDQLKHRGVKGARFKITMLNQEHS